VQNRSRIGDLLETWLDKQHIIDEIKRTAINGVALGKDRFEAETGIKKSDWWGIHWRSWSDAAAEAGCESRQFNVAYPDDFVLEKLVRFIRELGRYPSVVDLKMRARADAEFPTRNVFARLGKKAVLVERVASFCRQRSGFDDVLAICEATTPNESSTPSPDAVEAEFGFVYLIKSGRFYKIGRTNALGRREYELAIQLPEKAPTVHSIKTDDPEGIERYWHERFKDRRANGEWFELSPSDVAAFKRRKFM
jgi:hypothetical protein